MELCLRRQCNAGLRAHNYGFPRSPTLIGFNVSQITIIRGEALYFLDKQQHGYMYNIFVQAVIDGLPERHFANKLQLERQPRVTLKIMMHALRDSTTSTLVTKQKEAPVPANEKPSTN
mmetsp:Transcript_7096/g.19865  ORF Transcript_7096/g.19865 Transcript_7096/m.19865 type:complete len:118 (+) Transcript_7096:839-1192(+)|eukprot:CAMPEP_0168720206 /NCGR_PEP_ID=MMETSP0724-20121128/1439_1 /TAXON_ID=265536 /ORGANISM="Amphiprora sp., Strain CCMP467" /LENGTH=117 /DNA_ID=CAMNT_0008766793 /DNA_START=675 /DNA_END=1028 /DNA_ORIENTATION=+